MTVEKFSVTVAVDDVEITLSLADFRDGGKALPERAAGVAKITAEMLKEQLQDG